MTQNSTVFVRSPHKRTIDFPVLPAAAVPEPPKQALSNLMLILTESCNLRCTHCYEQYDGYKRDRRMPWETAKQAIDLFFDQIPADKNYSSITFFGGEPALEFPLIEQVVDYTLPHRTIGGYHGSKYNYVINTNGTLLSDDIYALFARLGPKLNIRLSVDGYGENHDMVRKTANGHGSWRFIEANLPLFTELKARHRVKVNMVTTINRTNYRSIYYDYTNLYDAARLPIGFLFVHEQDWEDHELDEIRYQVSMLHEWCMERGVKFPLCDFSASNSTSSYDASGAICGAAVSSMSVNYAGEFFPCHRTYYYGQGESLRLGDVRAGVDPERRARAAAINSLTRLPQKCQDCPPPVRKRCHVCYASNMNAYGDPHTVADKYCHMMWDIYRMANSREKAHAEAMAGLQRCGA